MEKLINFLIFSALIQLTVGTPLSPKSLKGDRIESKNWKLKNGLYGNGQEHSVPYSDPPTTYRLPNNTLPVRYDIFLTTDVHKYDFNFYGRVKIQIRAVETTDTVTLQYRDMNVTKVTFLDMNGQVVEHDVPFEYVEPRYYEFLRISLPRIMAVDEKFVLEITYSGILNEQEFGFYRAHYTDGDADIYYAVTQFEATDARHAFPCYDEPGIRTPFGLEIQHDKSYKAYSNMEIVSKTALEGTDYVVTKFEDTPSMQTYLLAFLVAPFEEVSNNNTQVPQRIIAKPSSIRNAEYEFSLPKLDPILKSLENLLRINFTLPKLDHAAITQFAAGAMENWGLVTYREIALLYVPTGYPESDEYLQKRIITIIAHEDAHQYFGNLVAPH
ncbi:aminopeptidase N-like, partial [Chironomus tepperi]|uniref:aminopeptidase N-like n=1 Tax=Chironomus tepperi TaxID=113505 RepID=UPI00391F23CF